MNMSVSASNDPAPEQDPESPPAALEIPAEAMSNDDGPSDTTFEPPSPMPMPDELSVPPIPLADLIPGLPGLLEVDHSGPQQAPEAISNSLVPERPMQEALNSVPDAPVPAIPPAPISSFFEQGNAQ